MSDAQKHTPGPWAVDDGDGRYCGIFGEDGNPVAYLCEPKFPNDVHLLPLDMDGSPDGYRYWEEHKANARLMAAAPDLLTALKAMVDRWEPDCVGLDRVMWENARAAIAQATDGTRGS
jgi:hypothetical protein